MRRFNWLTKKYVIFPLLLLALLAGAFPLLTHFHSAHAAANTPLCYGWACNDQDPIALGCTDSVNAYSPIMYNNRQVGYAINHYSSWCNANWLEFVLTDTRMQAGWGLRGEISTNPYTPFYYQEDFPESNGCYKSQNPEKWPAWTTMIDGSNMSYGTVELCSKDGAAATSTTYVNN